MIAIEADTRSPRKTNSRPALEIRFHFVDGSKQTFIQPDAEAAEVIRQRADSSNLFNQSRIVLGDDYSKSVFVGAQINRVDLVFRGPGFSRIPVDYADLVELTETEFHQCVPTNAPALLQRRDRQLNVGDLMVSILHLRMKGGRHVYLRGKHWSNSPQRTSHSCNVSFPKERTAYAFAGGGYGLLNLQNLIGYTVYPGVPELPADTWMAQPNTDL